ncbi:hypothetical protein M441DRAFT_404392 [Trichoderma asperellum CBS 433.97]|uniref:Uncharacterized protein n=1 Tax=Trichoderma asperellum (strain ATCC 204424 / CBS 433.97 / NBRC 101777) TaxID=1042311 RepID=A0A2T3ZAC8_TRIA4|nr:hypothetical protein M441DRAFT_404392 [Trichoderma asperellum CBS 433.97]PTB41769.1 hypothetical protein M441DRAFT_404392 [Trichoderma asperellum CBS 433.97]
MDESPRGNPHFPLFLYGRESLGLGSKIALAALWGVGSIPTAILIFGVIMTMELTQLFLASCPGRMSGICILWLSNSVPTEAFRETVVKSSPWARNAKVRGRGGRYGDGIELVAGQSNTGFGEDLEIS